MSESLRIYEVHAECCPLNDTTLNCLDCEHCVSVDGRFVECEYIEEDNENVCGQ